MTGKCLDPHRDDIISLCIDSVTFFQKEWECVQGRLGVGANDTSGGEEWKSEGGTRWVCAVRNAGSCQDQHLMGWDERGGKDKRKSSRITYNPLPWSQQLPGNKQSIWKATIYHIIARKLNLFNSQLSVKLKGIFWVDNLLFRQLISSDYLHKIQLLIMMDIWCKLINFLTFSHLMIPTLQLNDLIPIWYQHPLRFKELSREPLWLNNGTFWWQYWTFIWFLYEFILFFR